MKNYDMRFVIIRPRVRILVPAPFFPNDFNDLAEYIFSIDGSYCFHGSNTEADGNNLETFQIPSHRT